WLHWHLGDLDWKAAMLKQYGVGATLTVVPMWPGARRLAANAVGSQPSATQPKQQPVARCLSSGTHAVRA
ncbi:hypothetical protein, partial [Burkholderia ubonensis]|uniref:hypothetical protein n=1 Tax=Burkholderia ubonensis TaxID=101571 RepID=UPI001E5173F6